jgi:hypothetical protein
MKKDTLAESLKVFWQAEGENVETREVSVEELKSTEKEYFQATAYHGGKPVDPKEDIRTFKTGATRSPIGDKLQYEGYLNPLVLKRYAKYMKKHQTQSDGEQRASDNWQKSIPKESLMDSAYRHFEDWHLHHRGYKAEAVEPLEEALCALIFNAMAYLKQVVEGTPCL